MNIRETAAGFFRLLVDAAFPEHCLLCGTLLEAGRAHDCPVCSPCIARLTAPAGTRCETCGVPLISEERVCTRCRQRVYAFDRHRALFEYRGDVRELLYYYKFKHRVRLGSLFARLMAADSLSAVQGQDVTVVPVPSRRTMIRARGFKPVESLARGFARLRGLTFLTCLTRRAGPSQKTLDYDARVANLTGRITPLPAAAGLRGRSVICIDDIFTTGATAHECARVLKDEGAAFVTVLTVAMET